MNLSTSQGRLDALIELRNALYEAGELNGVYVTHLDNFIKQRATKVKIDSTLERLKTNKGDKQ